MPRCEEDFSEEGSLMQIKGMPGVQECRPSLRLIDIAG